MLDEASWLLSHAQALTDYGRTAEAAAELARAASCEEQAAGLLDADGQEPEAAMHRVSAASCFEMMCVVYDVCTLECVGTHGQRGRICRGGDAVRLDSVRELKASLNEAIIKPMAVSPVAKATLGMAAQPMAAAGAAGPTLALGVVRKPNQDYYLAVRIQRRGLENSTQLDTIKRKAKGEVDVRYIGRVLKFATPPQQKRARPLKIGVSVGHFKITAGTLGCFVRGLDPKEDKAVMILSNNHVLANENRAKIGDAILQPGRVDGGDDPTDKFATLSRFVRLKKTGANLVDAAVAVLAAGIEFNAKALAGLGGSLAGVGGPFLDEGTPVGKVGRTTATTKGKVTAFELDNVYVNYDIGNLQFNNQVEIEGDGDNPFSQGGDSGSLIVNADRKVVALLFAGGDHGGSNGKGLTYANPIDAVLRAMKVELLFS